MKYGIFWKVMYIVKKYISDGDISVGTLAYVRHQIFSGHLSRTTQPFWRTSSSMPLKVRRGLETAHRLYVDANDYPCATFKASWTLVIFPEYNHPLWYQITILKLVSMGNLCARWDQRDHCGMQRETSERGITDPVKEKVTTGERLFSSQKPSNVESVLMPRRHHASD